MGRNREEAARFVRFKNRKVAVLICVIVIALSILGSARRSLTELIKDTESIFVYGVDGNGKSIYYDLNSRAGLAQNLAVVADRYLEEDDSLVKALRSAATKLEKASTPALCYQRNQELKTAIDSVNNALLNQTLSAEDEKYREDILADLDSYESIIAHDGYNDVVRDLNENELKAFPARALKYLTFTGNAEYYG